MSNEFKIKKGLVVEGDARVTGAILDSTNAPGTSGQVLTSTVTGTDWKSLAEISGVDGTGTANYLSKWADADTITNSIVYDNGTNVGIGTATPNNKLTVNGNIETTGSGKIGFNVNDSYGSFPHYGLGYAGGANITNLAGYFGLSFGTNGSERMRITNAGNVGIGTTSPGAKLQVTDGSSAITLQEYSNGAAIFFDGVDGDFTGGDYFHILADSNLYLGLGGYAGGITPLNITNAGNVGIGTTSPIKKLAVSNNGAQGLEFGINTTAEITAYNRTTSTYIPMYFDASVFNFAIGNVGIGTTAPGAKLQIETSAEASIPALGANTSFLKISNSGGNYGTMIGQLGSGNSYIQTQRFDGTATAYNLLLQPNGGNVGIGTTNPSAKLDVETSAAGYAAIIKNTSAGGDYLKMIGDSGNTVFEFGSGGTGGDGFLNIYSDNSQKILINADGNSYFNSGNVGIGTTNPGEKLQVNSGNIKIEGGATSSIRGLIIAHTGQTGNQTLLVQNSTSAFGHLHTTERALRIEAGKDGGTGTGETLDFWVNGSERMMIDTTGNVGIGTTAPTEKLHVNGWIRLATNTGIKFDTSGSGGDPSFQVGSDVAFSWKNTASIETMRLDNAGNVGIGTINPVYKLAVQGAANDGIVLYGVGTTAPRGAISMDGSGNGYLESRTGSGGQNVMLRSSGVSWLTGGNVGIGTTSPTANLYVSGGNADATDKPTMISESVFTIKPVSLNSGNLSFAQVDSGNSIGMQYTNGAGTANWNISMQPFGGNVGIGTTSPGDKLVVDGVINSRNTALFYGDGSDNSASIAATGGPIKLLANGSERMRITSSGNVGIGTTAPSADLHIYENGPSTLLIESAAANGNDTYLALKNSAAEWRLTTNRGDQITGDQGDFFIRENDSLGNAFVIKQNTGNVGIGTTAPIGKLQVNTFNESNNALTIQASNYTSRTYGIGIDSSSSLSFYDNFSSLARLVITPTGNVGIGVAPSAWRSTEKVIQLPDASFYSGNNYAAMAQNYYIPSGGGAIYLESNFASDYYQSQGQHIWRYAASGTVGNTVSWNEAMRITSGGNVGIGTSSPDTKLQVNGTITSFLSSGSPSFGNGINILTSPGTYTSGDGGILQFQNEDVITGGIRAIRDGGSWGGSLLFYTHNLTAGNTFDSTFLERMRITSAGNVGIGTTSPSEKLHVTNSSLVGTTVGSNVVARFSTLSSGKDSTILLSDGVAYSSKISMLSGDLHLSTEGKISAVTVKATSGNVGIGTLTPDSKLDVTGGNITINTTSTTFALFKYGAVGSETSRGSITTDGIDLTINSTVDLILNPTGNVGIGTTSPTFKLDVSGTARINTTSTSLIKINSTGSGTIGRSLIQIIRNDGTEKGWDFGTNVFKDNSDNFTFREVGGTGDGLTRIIIKKTSGNVGIGTTGPLYPLDVSGVVNATSFSAGGASGFTGTVNFPSNPPGSQSLDFQGGLLVGVS